MKFFKKRQAGFTMLELLVVISIIAVIATLATGAAVRSIRQSRARRVEEARSLLKLGLANYRALHGEWPYRFNNPDASDNTYQTVTGAQNAQVFKAVFDDVKNNRSLIDTSVIMTRGAQGRITAKQALERGVGDIPVGYADPERPDIFRYFKIRYNFLTDEVSVLLETDG